MCAHQNRAALIYPVGEQNLRSGDLTACTGMEAVAAAGEEYNRVRGALWTGNKQQR
jgi:hypothetical protein